MKNTNKTMGLMAFFAVVLVSFLIINPISALANSYSMDSVAIEATLNQDGSLHVVEDREFNFDGDFNGVFWYIPQTSDNAYNTQVEVVGAGMVQDGVYSKFTLDNNAHSGDSLLYNVVDDTSSGTDRKKVTLYSPQDSTDVVYRVEYIVRGAVKKYRDTAELNWKFVSDGWDLESYNVTCKIGLPCPEGQEVTDKNTRVWAHGPLNGECRLIDGGASFEVPEVGTDEFAEARLCFDPQWVEGVQTEDVDMLPSILSEEQEYADESNRIRTKAQDKLKNRSYLVVAITTVLLALTVYCTRKLKESLKSNFTDEYFRDVPTDDHPAVLQCVMHAGEPDMDAFTASVIRLCDIGLVDLRQEVKTKGILKKEKTIYYLEGLSEERQPAKFVSEDVLKIDEYTLKTLRDIANLANADADTLYFDEMRSIAKKNPEKYNDYIEAWQTNISAIATDKGYIGTEKKAAKYKGLCIFLFAIIIPVLAVIGIFTLTYIDFLLWGSNNLLKVIFIGRVICIIALIAALDYLIKVTSRKKDLTSSGIEVYAKLEALKRWLTEFTRLDEAIPTDVVLWNRLLVMAVALGVADKVLENIKAQAPEILDDPAFASTYIWYMNPYWRPYAVFNNNAASAHAACRAALTTTQTASSSWSSGSGGGGGFSVGGGGGFGGGGGGGAF